MNRTNVSKKPASYSKQEFTFPLINANNCESKCIDLRSVKVLSPAEWKRLNDQINKEKTEAVECLRAHQAREEIKARSSEMVKDWTNTFMGARQKKLQDRKDRLEREEAEKVQIDLEEAKFQAEKRKEVIREAKIKQYYQSDRLKTFHTALTLTEALRERDLQLELKELIKSNQKDKDKIYYEKALHDLEQAIKEDQEKAMKRRQARIENAGDLKAQIRLHDQIREAEKAQLVVEGEELRRLAIAAQLERQRIDQTDRAHQRLHMEENLRQIEDVQRMRLIEKLKDEEEDEKCRIFAAAKRKMMQLRALKEKSIFDEKQANLERIKVKLVEQMAKLKDDEQERIDKAVAEREIAYLASEKEKEDKRAQRLAEKMADLRQVQERMAAERQAAIREAVDQLHARQEADRQLAEFDAARRAIKFAENKKLSDTYMKEVHDKELQRKRDREDETNLLAKCNMLANLEEELFQKYAKQVIEHCKANCRSTYALKKASRPCQFTGLGPVLPGSGIQLSLPAGDFSAAELLANKMENGSNNNSCAQQGNKVSSKERLGFVC